MNGVFIILDKLIKGVSVIQNDIVLGVTRDNLSPVSPIHSLHISIKYQLIKGKTRTNL